MKVNWVSVLDRLRIYPPGAHKFLPSCPMERIDAVQTDLGGIPEDIVAMLKHFNGAKLFVNSGPLVRMFGISTLPPLPPLEWAPDWCIDKLCPRYEPRLPRSFGM
jgi:hypothetical protein